ncbi:MULTISPECIES: 50S ribosomal protein L9 [unclassified Aureimonas]|uniref:50S ribosomal protein L9 n=1 Tax=unclassified Aureimonas TaxID=2615206 RepID=UPI0006F28199|nr:MULTISPECIES: 50S ribosomal protein L9 [unclassified Aureimonas]KQT52914.1 50S ribosomal protein L9 [Aureimonas sp. Leaf427]KQT80373.1 50S ribosomal protein L9 [Aureimonas sp. Leaf460]
MDVILLERITRLGQMGDTVRVKDGFARNYLLPTGRALRASEANRKKFESQKADLIARNEEKKNEAAAVAETLQGQTFTVVRSAGETGQMYGSVSARDISDILKENGFKVGRNEILLNLPIKAIGVHSVSIQLHADVEVSISLNIARSHEEAERQARGETLTSAAAIYGVDEDPIVPGNGGEDEIVDDESEEA